MIIRKTTPEAVHRAARLTGVGVESTTLSASRGGGHTLSVKVNLPYGEHRERYRRISPKGRRVNAVCWHGFRDFFRALFAITPHAVAKTMYATYDGAEGFEETYPATGHLLIGSVFAPMALCEACRCDDSGSSF